MDYETFFQSLLTLFKSGDNVYFVMYSVAACLLTQVCKKLFVSKVKVDVLHKFDLATVLPFVFGAVFALIDIFAVNREQSFGYAAISRFAVTTAAVGALASTIFRCCSSLGGKSLKSMMKDDVFGMFYSQLLYFGNVKEQLVNKTLSMQDFIAQVKLVSSNAMQIYAGDGDENDKRRKLAELLSGIVDEHSVNACVNSLNLALTLYAQNVKRAKETTK